MPLSQTHLFRLLLAGFLLLGGPFCGCGTTRWSDTGRTGTEQLLISNAIDLAVEKIDFGILCGKKVYLNTEAISSAVDFQYLRTTLRQYVAASGARLCDEVEECDFILEVRAGAVGTDRNDLLYGVPSIALPYYDGTSINSSQIPEIPLAKKTDQRAVVKIAVFAYDRETGHPLWASGNKVAESRAKAWWVFGTGPFNDGTIYNNDVHFAGDKVKIPFWKRKKMSTDHTSMPLFFESSENTENTKNSEISGNAESSDVSSPSAPNTPPVSSQSPVAPVLPSAPQFPQSLPSTPDILPALTPPPTTAPATTPSATPSPVWPPF